MRSRIAWCRSPRQVAQPGLECSGRAAARLVRVGVHGDALAGAVLVGFRAGDGEQQAAAGDRCNVADGQRHQLGAGSGKTALLQPLIEAWHADGRLTYGVTLAWRQSHALAEAGVGKRRYRQPKAPDTRRLTDAGVAPSHAFALTGFLKAVERGRVALDAKSVVIIDEIAQVGRKDIEMPEAAPPRQPTQADRDAARATAGPARRRPPSPSQRQAEHEQKGPQQ
jgi:hypothetical protein